MTYRILTFMMVTALVLLVPVRGAVAQGTAPSDTQCDQVIAEVDRGGTGQSQLRALAVVGDCGNRGGPHCRALSVAHSLSSDNRC